MSLDIWIHLGAVFHKLYEHMYLFYLNRGQETKWQLLHCPELTTAKFEPE